MKSNFFNTLLAASIFVSAAATQNAYAATSPNAAPFGLEIGVATCDAARTKLGKFQESKLDRTDVLLTSRAPESLYDGASKVVVRCGDRSVVAVQIEASKGGMGNDGSREVYSSLAKKYKLVAGGPMPQLGNGYARFQSGNSVIEQSSPHLSFEFTLTYYEKSFYDGIVASNAEQEQKASEKKKSAL